MPVPVEKPQRILYEYWDELPTIKTIDIASKVTISQKVRSAILTVLSNGVIDQIEIKKEEIRTNIRHVLTVREIQKEVNEYLQRDKKNAIKLTNIYFHLQKLQDLGLVQEVTTILEGNHHVAYFGCTAKFFSSKNPGEQIYREHSIGQNLVAILKDLRPNTDKENVLKLINQILERENEMFDIVTKWVEKHEKEIKTTNIDFWALTVFLNRLNILDPKLEQLYSEINQLIGFLQ
ncbi:MAG: hypothetical protein ACFFBD_28955 [Candidatus Hodarchaeota archaeon]